MTTRQAGRHWSYGLPRGHLAERQSQTLGDLLLEGREGDLVASQLELEMAITGQADTGGIRPVKSATVKLLSVVRPSISGHQVLVVILYMGEQVSAWVPQTWLVYHG